MAEAASLLLELELYTWAVDPAQDRIAARIAAERLPDDGIRAPRWTFEPVLAIARTDDCDRLDALGAACARTLDVD